MKTGLGPLLVLALLQTLTEAQDCPDSIIFAEIDENNAVDAVVVAIPVADTTILQILTVSEPFRLEGKNLVATESLDFETNSIRNVEIQCTPATGGTQNFEVIVRVNNLNDNPPIFMNAPYADQIDEMTPVGTTVGTFAATDADGPLDPLLYTLTDPSGSFILKNQYTPELLVNKVLQFDDGASYQLTLTVREETDPVIESHTDTTTITISIRDIDNRPPWFQPCSVVTVEGAKICPNTGYSGTVKLGVMETEPLDLTPNPIWAIDGDSGINEPIRYSIVDGDEGLFQIEQETGNVTLLKPVDVTKTVRMTVMAFQERQTYQFATTSLIVEVVITSDNLPQFEKTQYEAVVEGVGAMAVEAADNNKALKIVATDQDFAAAGGINPNMVYSIVGNADFTIIEGYLFMVNDVSAGLYNMQVKAVDSSNSEEAVPAALTVEVVKEPTTTAPPTTVTTPTAEPTTGKTTVPPTPDSTGNTSPQSPDPTTKPDASTNTDATNKPDPTTKPNLSPKPDPTTGLTTVDPAPTDPSSDPTSPGNTGATKPTSTPEGSTAHTDKVPVAPGGFTSADMAALGATLGVLLLICIVVIAVLAVKIQKGNSDWKKINEASAFRSSLGPSGPKEGVHYTNEAFQHDDDDKDDKGGTVLSSMEADRSRALPRPPSPIPEDEKKVKPILSRDKPAEDGYKAVWFKEDIDPNAKEEVVIIPKREEEDEDDDDEDSDEETKIPKVKFIEADGDSGLGDKEDSDEEKAMTSSL